MLYLARRKMPALFGGAAAVFTPLDLANLVAWYDASDATTLFQESTSPATPAIVDADPVGTWKDKSGNANHISAPADAARPLLKLGIKNGLPVVRFDNTNDALFGTIASSASKRSIFFVINKRSAPDANTRMGFIIGGTDSGGVRTLNSVSATLLCYYVSSSFPGSPLTGATATNWNIIGYVFPDATHVNFFVNSAASAQSDVPYDANFLGTAVRLNSYAASPGNLFGDYDIGELLVINDALSAASVTALMTYLNAKWAVY